MKYNIKKNSFIIVVLLNIFNSAQSAITHYKKYSAKDNKKSIKVCLPKTISFYNKDQVEVLFQMENFDLDALQKILKKEIKIFWPHEKYVEKLYETLERCDFIKKQIKYYNEFYNLFYKFFDEFQQVQDEFSWFKEKIEEYVLEGTALPNPIRNYFFNLNIDPKWWEQSQLEGKAWYHFGEYLGSYDRPQNNPKYEKCYEFIMNSESYKIFIEQKEKIYKKENKIISQREDLKDWGINYCEDLIYSDRYFSSAFFRLISLKELLPQFFKKKIEKQSISLPYEDVENTVGQAVILNIKNKVQAPNEVQAPREINNINFYNTLKTTNKEQKFGVIGDKRNAKSVNLLKTSSAIDFEKKQIQQQIGIIGNEISIQPVNKTSSNQKTFYTYF